MSAINAQENHHISNSARHTISVQRPIEPQQPPFERVVLLIRRQVGVRTLGDRPLREQEVLHGLQSGTAGHLRRELDGLKGRVGRLRGLSLTRGHEQCHLGPIPNRRHVPNGMASTRQSLVRVNGSFPLANPGLQSVQPSKPTSPRGIEWPVCVCFRESLGILGLFWQFPADDSARKSAVAFISSSPSRERPQRKEEWTRRC